jgi:hypothetical protein
MNPLHRVKNCSELPTARRVGGEALLSEAREAQDGVGAVLRQALDCQFGVKQRMHRNCGRQRAAASAGRQGDRPDGH